MPLNNDDEDYTPIHDEFTEAGVDIYNTPLDRLIGFENLGHSVAQCMFHPYGKDD